MATQTGAITEVIETEFGTLTVTHPKKRRNWGGFFRHTTLIGACASIVFPLLWVLMLSIKSLPSSNQPYIIPRKGWAEPLMQGYDWVITKRPEVFTALLNSVRLTVASVVLSVLLATLAGYALVHLRTPFKNVITAMLVASMFFPVRVSALAGLWEVQHTGPMQWITDSYGQIWPLVFPYVALTVALSVFIMRGVFETVPKELGDSARVDGASSFRTLVGIMLPLVRNGMVVVVIVNFVAAWGEFLLARFFTSGKDYWTLPVFISTTQGGNGAWHWPKIAALYILAIMPGLILFSLTQKYYMKGLQEGALKA